MIDKSKVWISFGEHGDVTNDQDWEVDEPALSKKFGDYKFYTHYSFREMENGEAYVHSSVVAEMQAAMKKTKEIHRLAFNQVVDELTKLQSKYDELDKYNDKCRKVRYRQAADITQLQKRIDELSTEVLALKAERGAQQ